MEENACHCSPYGLSTADLSTLTPTSISSYNRSVTALQVYVLAVNSSLSRFISQENLESCSFCHLKLILQTSTWEQSAQNNPLSWSNYFA